MKQSVLIFEPCLGAISGHWESLAETLTAAFSKRGFNVTLFGNQTQTQLHDKTLPVRPHFDLLPYIDCNIASNLESARKTYFHSFLSINIDDFGPKPLFVFPTVYPAFLEGALLWLEKLVDYGKIDPANVIFIFQFPHTCSTFHQPKLLGLSPFRQLYAVSSQLANVFQQQYQLPVKELPMPMPPMTVPSRSKQKAENVPLKIGYFGHTSVEKGFFFLHPLTQLTYKQPVEFHYQLNTNSGTEIAARAFKQPNQHVHCYWGHLSKAEMTKLMAEMDILLLPYNSFLYATMPSAMFSESLLLGKVLVIPANTWLSEQSALFYAGVTTFADYTLNSIYKALSRAIEQYAQLQPMSQTASIAFQQYHNVDNFVNIILKSKEKDSIPA